MTQRLDLFSTPVIVAKHPQADALNTALLKAIHEERGRSAGLSKSNIGGWHSDTTMTDWGGEAAVALSDWAINLASGNMKDTAPQKREFQWGAEMWANINPPGASNQLHCHPGAYWSAVYYPDPGGADEAGKGGELVLEDPRYPMAYSTVQQLMMTRPDGPPMLSQFPVRPAAGQIVIFPGWLKHSVRPHGGTRERVSIAINLMLMETSSDVAR